MAKEPAIPFYDRPQADRIHLTMAAIRDKRTVFERWVVLADPEASPWNARAALAAEWLADEFAVADLGCGTMNLERHLRPSQTYIPIDVVSRDSRTIVCDFNCESPPPTLSDAAACLGILEYVHNLRDFLNILSGQYKLVVVSYCVTDAPSPMPQRREHAWVNDMDTPKMEALFLDAGWKNIESRWVDSMQKLWRISK